MKIPYIEIVQPIGSFYITKVAAADLLEVVDIMPRNKFSEGVQREESVKRINEISRYCSDPDATFPTPIIISVYNEVSIQSENGFFIFGDGIKIGEVIDGQHRLKGIKKSDYAEAFELPVILMFNLTNEEKAYVFSIINSKQTRVSMSLIYDLFELTTKRSPQKTVHEIARSFNQMQDSPFYNRMKMLGKKREEQPDAILSQGTFVHEILKLISRDPDEDLRVLRKGDFLSEDKKCPLREYFIKDEDQIILKILINYFTALKKVFPEEWSEPENNILWKTTGFGGVVKAFPSLFILGSKSKNLTQDFFVECFQRFKNALNNNGKHLTGSDFPSNAATQQKIAQLIEESNISQTHID